MIASHIRPAGVAGLSLPTRSRRALLGGLAMWSATRPRARLLQHGYRLLALTFGAHAIPGRRVELDLSLGRELRHLHEEEWRRWFGEFDSVAVLRPSQSERGGFAVLLQADDRNLGFVKCRPNWDPAREIESIERVAAATTFSAPRVVGSSDFGEWTSVGYTALERGIHSPVVRASVSDISTEVSELLASRISGDGQGWLPMHGDMGPWNLRWLNGRAVLIDWEHVGVAPPHADLVFHHVTARAMHLRSSIELSRYLEACDYWEKEIRRRFGQDRRDQRLAQSATRLLAAAKT